MKRLKLFALLAAFVVISGVIAWGVARFFGNSFVSAADIDKPVGCHSLRTNHLVVIHNSQATPWHTYSARCDTMTIRNQDEIIRLIAFGPHEHHTPYDGVKEKVLGPGQSLTITLNAAGTYHFHDHIHDTVTGEFTVSP